MVLYWNVHILEMKRGMWNNIHDLDLLDYHLDIWIYMSLLIISLSAFENDSSVFKENCSAGGNSEWVVTFSSCGHLSCWSKYISSPGCSAWFWSLNHRQDVEGLCCKQSWQLSQRKLALTDCRNVYFYFSVWHFERTKQQCVLSPYI